MLADAVADPSCAGVVLVGAAGVGKSRLTRELFDLVAAGGRSPVAIRASRSASSIPLAALLPLFTALGLPPGEDRAPLHLVADAVAQLGADQRLVLLVDDAQELDQASTAVLDQIVGREGTFVLLTVRSGSSNLDGVIDLWKDERTLRVDLGPLHDDELRTLVATVLDGHVDGGTMRTFVSVCGGNVLYLRELLQGALESGKLRRQREMWRLDGSIVESPRLRELIHRRFMELPEADRAGIELVALGEPLELAVLSSLVGPDVVERLERRGAIEAADGADGLEFRLGHPLYGETLRAGLPAMRRARYCRELADAREALGIRGAQALMRVAVWRLDGGGGTPETMLAAARAAFRTDDLDLAARLSRAAWEAGRLVDAAVLFAEALDSSRRTGEVETVLREAYPLARNDGERTAVALGLASAVFVWRDDVEGADAILSAAAAAVTDDGCRRRIEAQRGNHHLLSGDVARAIEFDRPLLEVTGDRAYAQAARDIGTALALAGQSSAAIGHIESALSVHQDLGEDDDMSAVAVFVVALSLAYGEAGRLADATAVASAGYDASIERENPSGQAWFACILALARVSEGRLAIADRLFRETATIFGELGHPGQRWGLGGIALATGQLADAKASGGALAELDALGQRATSLMDVHIARGRAWAAVAASDLATARRVLEGALELAEGWGQLASAAAVLHDLVRLDGGRAPAERLVRLSEQVDGELMAARVTFARAVLGRDPDLAAAASQAFEACGAMLFAAEASAVEGRLTASSAHRRRAAAANQRVAGLLESCEGARTPLLAVGGGGRPRLSAREQQVAVLAAEGLTSREIGERLYVSRRTVDNHLQRVFTRFGISSRAELAALLGEPGGP